MFRRREKSKPDAAPPTAGAPAAAPAGAQDEPLLDALATVLRAFGDLAFDLVDQDAAQIRESFDGARG